MGWQSSHRVFEHLSQPIWKETSMNSLPCFSFSSSEDGQGGMFDWRRISLALCHTAYGSSELVVSAYQTIDPRTAKRHVMSNPIVVRH